MNPTTLSRKWWGVGFAFVVSLGWLALLFNSVTYASPIAPPEGAPKLSLSLKQVTPTLTYVGGAIVTYTLQIQNTGAYTATDVWVEDIFPTQATYRQNAWASSGLTPTVVSDVLRWQGMVGFDDSVWITFSMQIHAEFSGALRNTATLTYPQATRPLSLTAETIVTDQPILTLSKSALPIKPGANKQLTYTLVVRNLGQPTGPDYPLTVTEVVPLSTTVRTVGLDGQSAGNAITWTRDLTLGWGDATVFTFSVNVGDVPSGTVLVNADYAVAGEGLTLTAGAPYSVTVVDPIFRLSKTAWPDPAGANRELTYTLTLLNVGSLATQVVISDRIPTGVTYRRGGTRQGAVVSWQLPTLDTGESAQFTYTVYIGDVLAVPVVNRDYRACSAEDVCYPGVVLTQVVQGPTFEVFATIDPIAKKPGGGSDSGPVTPTLVIRNLGPGNALDAQVQLKFERISVSSRDMVPPLIGALGSSYKCGDKCVAFDWVGDLRINESVTFTTYTGVSTVGGEEGTGYTATATVSDTLGPRTTEPISGAAIGKVTHMAYLQTTKTAPSIIGRGQEMTYTLKVVNTALATDNPPYPYLLDAIPLSVTVLEISHGGQVISGASSWEGQFISWTLPAFGTGDSSVEPRWFRVRVAGDLVSGTQIVNDAYHAHWFESEDNAFLYAPGNPVTTTVLEVGLIDSFKSVTPTLARPGANNRLTYTIHVVNSSALPLQNVTVADTFPWQVATYQRDAVASAGTIVSDIVSLRWKGNVAAFATEFITFSVVVDTDYSGPVANTAVISHPGLLEPVEVEAVAYITTGPVLKITKRATPETVAIGEELDYTLNVINLGQSATGLVITDTLPENTSYIAGSATQGGQLVKGQMRWTLPVLVSGDSIALSFGVTVSEGLQVRNADYAVRCAEGVTATGEAVITPIANATAPIYLPLVMRKAL